ncbi:MAG: hypothetical protein HYS08_10025 [Chlamydiae bacterium]|nr:hypothetical protein [Chlamydiota bacterium]MBI3267016.1 hypothetical protein [Chlamydiota bacterium]
MRRYYSQAYLKARRRQAGVTRWSVVVRTFLCLVFGIFLALFYVWQNVQVVRMGYQIKEKERMALELSKHERTLETDLSALKMPSRIMIKAEEEGLGLAMSDVLKVVKLHEEPVFYEDDLMSSDWGKESLDSASLLSVAGKGMD